VIQFRLNIGEIVICYCMNRRRMAFRLLIIFSIPNFQ
jgi:hypothetical protein